MTTFTIELPERVVSDLARSPSDVEKDVHLAVAVEWYRRGLISQGRAAELAGLSRAEFIDELAARKIDTISVDVEELRSKTGA